MFAQQLQQLVPSEWCFSCRRCCRFPSALDAQTPVFSAEEVKMAVKSGAQRSWFCEATRPPSHDVVLREVGEEHRCPALHSTTHECSIYSTRPLDCRLYPFVVAQDANATRLLLGIDTQCPYIQQLGVSRLRDYALYVSSVLESEEGRIFLRSNPGMAGRFREEFVWVHPLPIDGFSSPHPDPRLKPFQEHQKQFQAIARSLHSQLSAYQWAVWWPWESQGVMRLWWAEISEVPAFLYEQAGHYALALPPLTADLNRETVGRFIELLRSLDPGSKNLRIENLSEAQAKQFQSWGYEIYQVECEYLYRRQDLLKPQKPQRGTLFRNYKPSDLQACSRLHLLWSLRKQMTSRPEEARLLLRDALYLHQSWLRHADQLDIQGWVAEIDGEIRGYVLGVELTSETFVILAEITDTEYPLLAQELQQHVLTHLPHAWINAMGDAALDALTQVKSQAGPCQKISTFTARQTLI